MRSSVRHVAIAALVLAAATVLGLSESIAATTVWRWNLADLLWLGATTVSAVLVLTFAHEINVGPPRLLGARFAQPIMAAIAAFLMLEGTRAVLSPDWRAPLALVYALSLIGVVVWLMLLCYQRFDEIVALAFAFAKERRSHEPSSYSVAVRPAETAPTRVASPQTARRDVPLCGSCNAALDPGQRFCGHCGQATE